jgi:hypothetical protein
MLHADERRNRELYGHAAELRDILSGRWAPRCTHVRGKARVRGVRGGHVLSRVGRGSSLDTRETPAARPAVAQVTSRVKSLARLPRVRAFAVTRPRMARPRLRWAAPLCRCPDGLQGRAAGRDGPALRLPRHADLQVRSAVCEGDHFM